MLKSLDALVQILKKTQDELEKMSNYKGYNPTDNIKRKASRTGEEVEGAGKNVAVRSYSTKPGQLSAKDSAAAEQKKYKRINRKQPVKTLSPEEIKAAYPQASLSPKIKKDEDVEKTQRQESDIEAPAPIYQGKDSGMKDKEEKKLKMDGKSVELLEFNKCGQWMFRNDKKSPKDT